MRAHFLPSSILSRRRGHPPVPIDLADMPEFTLSDFGSGPGDALRRLAGSPLPIASLAGAVELLRFGTLGEYSGAPRQCGGTLKGLSIAS